MEKTFRRYERSKPVRQAFVEAEAAEYLAHQICAMRLHRGWTQAQLAKRMGKPQGVISRLEDPDYGRVSFKTMVELSRAFDVAPVLMFRSTIQLLKERWIINRAEMEVPSFKEEAALVAFESPLQRNQIAAHEFELVSNADAAGDSVKVVAMASSSARAITARGW